MAAFHRAERPARMFARSGDGGLTRVQAAADSWAVRFERQQAQDFGAMPRNRRAAGDVVPHGANAAAECLGASSDRQAIGEREQIGLRAVTAGGGIHRRCGR